MKTFSKFSSLFYNYAFSNITFSKSYFDASGQFGQVDGGGHYVSDAGSETFKVTILENPNSPIAINTNKLWKAYQ